MQNPQDKQTNEAPEQMADNSREQAWTGKVVERQPLEQPQDESAYSDRPELSLGADANSNGVRVASANAIRPVESFPAFDFDAKFRDVAFNGKPGADKPKIVVHRLRRPTKDETYSHQIAQTSQTTFQGGESQVTKSPGTYPDYLLWQKVVTHVKGYNFHDGSDRRTFVEVTAARMEMIPWQHAQMALNAFYTLNVRLIEDEPDLDELLDEEDDGGFSVSTAPLRFRVDIGSQENPLYSFVWVTKRADNEARKRFELDRATSQQRGVGKGAVVNSSLNYSAYQAYMKALTLDFENARVGGKHLSQVWNNLKGRALWLGEIEDFFALDLVEAYTKAFKAGALG